MTIPRSPPRARAWLLRLAPLVAATVTAPARAADDGAYGRLEGDVELRAGAGTALAAGGPALSAGAAAVYLSTAGLYANYTDALGGDAPVERSIAAGLHFSPLFLGRYASDLEHGPPRLDLLLDSLALGVGAFWDVPRGQGLTSRPGLELALSAAFPLWEDATGPFIGLRGALRWRAVDLAGGGGDLIEQGALASLTIGWHHVFTGHVIDARDGLQRSER